jgi:hypothetical protein
MVKLGSRHRTGSIARFVPRTEKGGRPREASLREVVIAIFYIAQSWVAATPIVTVFFGLVERHFSVPQGGSFWRLLPIAGWRRGRFAILIIPEPAGGDRRTDFLTGQTVSLWEALLSVPDHRRPEGKRYPLAGLLLIAIAALLAGRRDQLGIIRWGRRLSRDTLTAIGIERARIPAPSVGCELFQDLDIVALEQALGAWVQGGSAPGHVAIDGKRLRGSATAHRSAASRVFRQNRRKVRR